MTAWAETVDYDDLMRAFPPPPHHLEELRARGPDERSSLQHDRLRATLNVAAELPFYATRWRQMGVDQAAVADMALTDLPTFDVHDLRASLDAAPPFGQHQMPVGGDLAATPHRVHFSGGSTGLPRPVLHSATDREIGELIQARHLWHAGYRPGDAVLSSFAYGMHNGATTIDQALARWLGCLVIPVSTGKVTSTRRQVELAHHYGARGWIGWSDYLVQAADVAREVGLDPRRDFAFRSMVAGGDVQAVERAWGVPTYSLYGTSELQTPAGECSERRGLHVADDAYVVEVLDPATGDHVDDGEDGHLVFTSLYNQAFPLVRFDTLDISRIVGRDPCACGQNTIRIAPMTARADTMLKFRGLNVWPEALAEAALELPDLGPSWAVVLDLDDAGRERLTVHVEARGGVTSNNCVAGAIEKRIRRSLELRVDVRLADNATLARMTGLETRTKPQRVIDRRSPAD